MPITRDDVVRHLPTEDGQTLLAGLTFPDEYPLERFIFDLLNGYSKAQKDLANNGGESIEFVRGSGTSLLTETEDGDYKFQKSFTVSGTVTVGVESFEPSRTPTPTT